MNIFFFNKLQLSSIIDVWHTLKYENTLNEEILALFPMVHYGIDSTALPLDCVRERESEG